MCMQVFKHKKSATSSLSAATPHCIDHVCTPFTDSHLVGTQVTFSCVPWGPPVSSSSGQVFKKWPTAQGTTATNASVSAISKKEGPFSSSPAKNGY